MSHFSKEQFEKSLVIFTDGSSLGNPGPGGYGAVMIVPQMDELVELGGNKTRTTNNEMELTAVIAALSHSVFNTAPTHIFTDSSYVINGITKWVHGWEKNGWKTSSQDEVANKSLWQSLLSLVRGRETSAPVSWHYVPGHVGVLGNERCDEIATGFAKGTPPVLYRGAESVFRKESGKDFLDFSIDEELSQKKSSRKSKSSEKAYSYLSQVDGVVMKHATWAECEARVTGKPAKFKKALSLADEQAIIQSWNS